MMNDLDKRSLAGPDNWKAMLTSFSVYMLHDLNSQECALTFYNIHVYVYRSEKLARYSPDRTSLASYVALACRFTCCLSGVYRYKLAAKYVSLILSTGFQHSIIFKTGHT